LFLVAREGLNAPEELLEVAIGNAIRRTGGNVPDDAVLQSFCIIAEWESLEGDQFVTETRSVGLSEWRRLGLLYHAINTEEEEEED
jgi:hypothetical protein